MKRLHFNEIKVFDDTMDDMDIMRSIIKAEGRENAFYLADIGGVIKKHQEWISKMPRVIPHFGMFTTCTYILLFLIYRSIL